MSETEEPPAKVIKIDNNDKEISIPEIPKILDDNTSAETSMENSVEATVDNASTEVTQSEQTEEGQEEWLSEGVLTDDDYQPNTTTETTQPSEDSQPSEPTTTTEPQPEPPSEPEPETSQEPPTPEPEASNAKTVEQNIEETLNQMDGKDKGEEEDMDAFLEKNNTESNGVKKEEADVKKEEKDDGNDTDDLLRMLGEDDNKAKKKLTKTVKDLRSSKHHVTSDEDDFEYDETSLKKIKAAKSAISKKTPPKAVPEDIGDGDDDDTGLSSDEAPKKETSKKKQYNTRKPNILAKKLPPSQNLVVVKKAPEKQILNVVEKQGRTVNPPKIVTKQVITKPVPARSILKTSTPAKMVASTPKHLRGKDQGKKLTFQPPEIKTPAPFKSNSILKTKPKIEPLDDEKVEDEELPYEDEELDSDFEEELNRTRQRIMKPEQMDEEIPSDGDSHSEDGSLYDELPTSDSEDMDDWFQIDIRGEKASDYLPLLGPKARELLLEEKRRVSERVTNLRQSLSALTESGKRQADHLRSATMSLAEIDDMLKAT